MAAVTYLPAPVKVERNETSDKPSFPIWLASTVALGTLAYYAPKIFLATCGGIIFYQVHRFNQLVHTADNTQHEQIRTWTINACVVMSAIGSVFLLKSLPCVWSALKDVRHLHILRSIGHLVKASVFVCIGTGFDFFSGSAITLASQRSWVKMEDYVENYPQDIKQNVLSSPWKKLAFYISAVLPETFIAERLSRNDFAFIQFSSNLTKASFVRKCCQSRSLDNWNLAIHQLQQLPPSYQLHLAPELAKKINSHFDVDAQNAFPNDVKALLNSLLIGARLKDFKGIPLEQSYVRWQELLGEFNQLDLDQQEILGDECLRLLGDKPQNTELLKTSSEFRLAALKAYLLANCYPSRSAIYRKPAEQIEETKLLANALLSSLSSKHRPNLGAFLIKSIENLQISLGYLSEEIKAVIPNV